MPPPIRSSLCPQLTPDRRSSPAAGQPAKSYFSSSVLQLCLMITCGHSRRGQFNLTGFKINHRRGQNTVLCFPNGCWFPTRPEATDVIITRSVDAQTCRVIALDRAVGSMTSLSRSSVAATRVHEDTKKFYFTLIDFRQRDQPFRRSGLFDGEPVQIYEPHEGDPVAPPDDALPTDEEGAPLPENGWSTTVSSSPGGGISGREPHPHGALAESVALHRHQRSPTHSGTTRRDWKERWMMGS